MFELLQIIDVIIGFGGGLLVSRFFHKPSPQETLTSSPPVLSPITPTVGPGPDRVYVRFNFADGRIEVRKFKATDLDLTLSWKDRLFEAGEWTPDGHIYREVVA